MSANIPPGISYLVKSLPQLLLPPCVVSALLYFYRLYAVDNVLSARLVTTLYILSFPMALMISVVFSDISNRVAARRMNATMLPAPSFWEDPTPGSLVSLYRAMKSFRGGYPGDGLENRLVTTGPTFNFRVLFQDRVVTFEPNHIKAVLATQFEDFDKGEDAVSTLGSLLGTGVFAVDGELWKFHRSLTRPFFAKDKITHFDIFDRHAEQAIEKMKTRFKEGYAVDFQDVVSRFTLDSATEFLFGSDIGTLSDPLPYPFFTYTGSVSPLNQTFSAQFSRAFNEAQVATAYRTRFGLMWPLFEFWKDHTKEKMKLVHGFLEPIINEGVRRSKMGQNEKKHSDDETVLDHLIAHTEDRTIIRDEIMNLAVAGRDTTASLMTFTVYMLSQHPHILRKLREEILTVIGPHRRPTYDDLRDMKYLRAVLNETLRLYPPVPFDGRQSNKHTTLPPVKKGDKPLFIPAGTRVVYALFVMHRRTDLWGPDALKFDPERFLDERVHKYLTPNPFIFLPFNAGPRICLGQQFAYNESSFFLVRLLQNFSTIELSEESQPPDSKPPESWKEEGGTKATEKVQLRSHLTMYVAEGLWVKMGEAPATEDF
ncbi:hypothetical protein GYMLUDRAFT_49511 [Collybiopsis luxurians FD-317 M1]|uniref:Cytochrome P450 n=1 Tax=Collybiopsis luxurians FD-317 M1 TaxID=944289 RepID=A0A0D0AS00_9AGAR|nr:hypothetical protein GYMLUDRAFT_49511 [Collybiopsis luxurians FD-317 M1]